MKRSNEVSSQAINSTLTQSVVMGRMPPLGRATVAADPKIHLRASAMFVRYA
jgi:hypothetical protein